jgi:hypothetical protein
MKLQEQPLQALLILLERPGDVLKRDELQKRLWHRILSAISTVVLTGLLTGSAKHWATKPTTRDLSRRFLSVDTGS